MKLTQNLKWRYSTKQFDVTKIACQSNIEKMKEAIQLSISSYGLQPYKIPIIKDKELKEKLKPAS
jgi:nitroreductase